MQDVPGLPALDSPPLALKVIQRVHYFPRHLNPNGSALGKRDDDRARVARALLSTVSFVLTHGFAPLRQTRGKEAASPVDTDREGCLGEGLSIPYIKAGNLCFISVAVNGRALNANVSVCHPRTDRLSPLRQDKRRRAPRAPLIR